MNDRNRIYIPRTPKTHPDKNNGYLLGLMIMGGFCLLVLMLLKDLT